MFEPMYELYPYLFESPRTPEECYEQDVEEEIYKGMGG